MRDQRVCGRTLFFMTRGLTFVLGSAAPLTFFLSSMPMMLCISSTGRQTGAVEPPPPGIDGPYLDSTLCTTLRKTGFRRRSAAEGRLLGSFAKQLRMTSFQSSE